MAGPLLNDEIRYPGFTSEIRVPQLASRVRVPPQLAPVATYSLKVRRRRGALERYSGTLFFGGAAVAQLAEQLFCKQQVTGSIPVGGSGRGIRKPPGEASLTPTLTPTGNS